MSIDKTDEEKRADLIYELVKERYDDQVSRLRKLDDQARTLISSILMGVGFLLAAGTTSFINVRTPTFILYFIVLGLLLASMVIDFMVLRIRIILIQHHVDTLFERYTEMSYEEVLKRFTGIAQLMVHDYEETGNQKSHLLIVAWYFLIIGLIAVLMFVVTSVMLYQDNEITI